MDKTLKVRILSPQQLIFQGDALSITSTNSSGKFDILPYHASFITLIQDSPIIIRTPSKQVLTYKFSLAIIYASNSEVNIYTKLSLDFKQTA